MKKLALTFPTASADVATAFRERSLYAVGVGDQSKERCPVFPFAFRIFRWNLEDPTAAQGSPAERLDVYRRVRRPDRSPCREFLAHLSGDRTQHLA